MTVLLFDALISTVSGCSSAVCGNLCGQKRFLPGTGEDSPVPGRKRFSLLCGLYCNSGEGVMQVVSAQTAAQMLSRNRQRIASRIYLLEIELTLRNSRHKITLQPRCL